MSRIAFLGPLGTFHEQALLTQPDLAEMDLVPTSSIAAALAAVDDGTVDYGFAAVENAIEGSVNVTVDTLAFERDLLIQREVVIRVQLALLALPGVGFGDVRRIVSFPVATAQCRKFLADKLPDAEIVAVNSTAEAARVVGEEGWDDAAAIGPLLAGELYGLDVLESDVEDHPENETRFALVARQGIPRPTGHDKTSIVCFQQADRPGSLLSILQEFAARAINLTKLESRPTKKGLGNYCFFMDFEGHVADELVADLLRDLRAKVADVRFLGSYPAAGEHGDAVRREADAAWRAANVWVSDLRRQITF